MEGAMSARVVNYYRQGGGSILPAEYIVLSNVTLCYIAPPRCYFFIQLNFQQMWPGIPETSENGYFKAF